MPALKKWEAERPPDHKEKQMAKHGKKYREASKRYDKQTPYPAPEALELVKTLAPANFDETVEAVFNLGIDPKKADQLVRGTVSLPHGTGKDVRVAVFAPAEKEKEATEAGAAVLLVYWLIL